MSNQFYTFKGEFNWARFDKPEESPFPGQDGKPKSAWKTQFKFDTQDDFMKFMDLQSKGVKNKVSKAEDGRYFINASRPTEIKTKNGVVKIDPPKVFGADGATPLDKPIGNGSKGELTLEVYEHKTPNGGKAHAARLHSATITDLVEYVPNS